MEIIKDLIKQIYPLLLMLSCVLFVVGVFFTFPMYEKEGVFQGAGSLFGAMKMEEMKTDSFDYGETLVSTYVPRIAYVAKPQTVGTAIPFKAQFEVEKENGSIVGGDVEDEFSIYLLDIKNAAEKSVLMVMTTEEMESIEEIPAPFVYEEERDILHCFQSGVFTMELKVCSSNGGQKIYKFQLPVDTK